jgi:2'-5' RNA ligase
MAARIQPHVTVIYELEDLARITDAVAATPALRLRIGAPALWDAGPNGIYLTVSDQYGDLARFRAKTLSAPAGGFQPHVTILHRDSVTSTDQVNEAWSSLRDERFDADFIAREVVVYELVDDVWRGAGRLSFG